MSDILILEGLCLIQRKWKSEFIALLPYPIFLTGPKRLWTTQADNAAGQLVPFVVKILPSKIEWLCPDVPFLGLIRVLRQSEESIVQAVRFRILSMF